jgi:hypothetical protein
MTKTTTTLCSLAATMALSACMGGGGSSGVTSSSGKAVDGYLKSASVLCDGNNNAAMDSGEIEVITNDTGDFIFFPACSSTIVVTGGTSIDTGLPFKGLIKAPAGSKVVTPLTTLLANGLSPAQLASALGVADDVTKIDPVSNPDLLKKTLAVQQIMQQTANSIAALGANTTGTTIEAVYAEVSKAMSAALAGSIPLIDASGNVNVALVTRIVEQSAANVIASSNPGLAVVSGVVGNYDKTSIAKLIAPAIAAQAGILARSTNVIADAKTVQSDVTVANVTAQVAPALLTGNAGIVDVDKAGEILKDLSLADATDNTAAEENALQQLNQQLSALPGTTVTTPDQPTNYLEANRIIVDGMARTLTDFAAGVPMTMTSLGIPLTVKGTAIPLNTSGANSMFVGIAAEMAGTDGRGQVLQIMIDKINLTQNGSAITAAVPSGATLYVYGKSASGLTGNAKITNLGSLISSDNNTLVLNVHAIMTQLIASASGQSQPVFNNLNNLTGRFKIKLAVSEAYLRKADRTPFEGFSVLLTGSDQPAVRGPGVEGIVDVQ